MDVSIDVGNYRFNYRVAGLIKKGNEILVHHCLKSNHVTLPGGRVKSGEDSITALKREIEEEMGEKTEYIKPIDIVENIFREKDKDKDYHEILIVHELKFVNKNAYERKIEPIEHHKKGKLEFFWYDLKKENDYSFRPIELFNILKDNNNELIHCINDEVSKRNR